MGVEKNPNPIRSDFPVVEKAQLFLRIHKCDFYTVGSIVPFTKMKNFLTCIGAHRKITKFISDVRAHTRVGEKI